MFVAHGTADNVVPQKQSQRMIDALAAAEIEHVWRPVVGAGHGFGNQSPTVDAEAIAFLRNELIHLAGDFNRDHALDGRDFLVWQRELGSTPAIPGAGADANLDGVVNDADLPIWSANLGGASFPAAANKTSTPEPCAAALLLTSSIAFAQPRRRARRGAGQLPEGEASLATDPSDYAP
jgi:hypothetical protein